MKGVAFSIDALFALSVVLSIIPVFLLLNLATSSPNLNEETLHYFAEDAVKVLSEMTVEDALRFSSVNEMYVNGEISQSDFQKPLLDLIGRLWITSDSSNLSKARDIIKEVLSGVIPSSVGWAFSIEKEILYNTSILSGSYVMSSKRLISGYSKEMPSRGCMARMFLERIRGKSDSSYAFFGGFIGEGNITAVIREIPEDAKFQAIYLEANLGTGFDFYINGKYCRSFNKSASFFEADSFEITDSKCLGNLTKGSNFFYFNFSGNNTSIKYFGGGFIRVSYSTSSLLTPSRNYSRHYFSGVQGLMNIYDSFYVPGNIINGSIRLVLRNNYTTYLIIGNKTVLSFNGTNSTQVIDLPNSNLSLLLNYSSISFKTVPFLLRAAANYSQAVVGADVVLVTDTSGSMNWRLSSSYTGTQRNCSSPDLYSDSTARISLAKCLAQDFVKTILSGENNRVGLVAYYGDPSDLGKTNVKTIRSFSNLSQNTTALLNQINAYTASGATGICGAMRQARKILQDAPPFGNSTRKKYIILMTDGIANVECNVTPSAENSTIGCIPNLCPSTSPCGRSCEYSSSCGDYISDASLSDALNDSIKARNYTNATIFTIGFGPVSSCNIARNLLSNISYYGNGSYYGSSNAYELMSIYHGLSERIVIESTSTQIINTTSNISTIVYPDSFIHFDYMPQEYYSPYGEISLTLQTPRFPSCNGSFFIPPQFKVKEAKITSYSEDYWTSLVRLKSNATNNSWISAFNLTEYGRDYSLKGDPYLIYLPNNFLSTNSTNYVSVYLAKNGYNLSSICSSSNRVIYDVRFNASVGYGRMFPECSGGNYTVYYDLNYDGVSDGFVYTTFGENFPNFNSNASSIESLDIKNNGLHEAFFRLLRQMNFVNSNQSAFPGSQNNPVNIELTPQIGFESASVGGIPYLWGPIEVGVIVWQ